MEDEFHPRSIALRGPQVCRVKSFDELLKYGLQKRRTAFGLPLARKESCHVDRGPQFPGAGALETRGRHRRAYSLSAQMSQSMVGPHPKQLTARADILGEAATTRRRSIYEARVVAAGLAFRFTAAISVFAAGPEELGFCPVISSPSLTT